MGIMEKLFGGKKHTREGYQKLEEEMKLPENAKQIYQFNDPRGQVPQEPTRMRAEIREDMDRLQGEGQAEANEMNAQDDRISAEAQQAQKAAEAFEKEKLEEKLGITEGAGS